VKTFERIDFKQADCALAVDSILGMVEVARGAGEPWALSWTPKLLREEIQEAELYGVRSAESRELQGFVLLRFRAERAEITLVAVFPSARGLGVLDHLVSECAALSSGIDLEVRADNVPAIQAYERNGFQAVGRRPRYYADGVDAVLYSRG